jgi:hypothetical protein
MNARTLFSNYLLYLSWCLLSSAWLVVAKYVDPHVFGLSAFSTAGISGLLVLCALILSHRQLPWAGLSAVPSMLAFMLLSTYKWA